jgi:hypothetical protein
LAIGGTSIVSPDTTSEATAVTPEMATNAVTAAKEGMDTRKGSQIRAPGRRSVGRLKVLVPLVSERGVCVALASAEG